MQLQPKHVDMNKMINWCCVTLIYCVYSC